MEEWNGGMMEEWNSGILEEWNGGRVEGLPTAWFIFLFIFEGDFKFSPE